jgi:outer membrane protein assembly factor BamA
MRHRIVPQFLLFPLSWLFVCALDGRAQSALKPHLCCPPSASCENLNETNEGKVSPKIIIDDATIDGAVHLPTPNLEQLLTLLKQKEYVDDSRWIDDIENDVRSAWGDEGYYKAQVTAKAVPLGSDVTHEHFSVAINVDEGLQYRVGSIEFSAAQDSDFDGYESLIGVTLLKRKSTDEGYPAAGKSAHQPIFPQEELRTLIPLREGDILDTHKVREGLVAVQKLYADNGYIDITVMPRTDIDDHHQIVSLLFELYEQKQYRVGKIDISGLDASTKNSLVWRIKPGDIFDSELFEAFFTDNQSLLPAGASPSNNSEISRNKEDGTADIKFNFSPCPRQ